MKEWIWKNDLVVWVVGAVCFVESEKTLATLDFSLLLPRRFAVDFLWIFCGQKVENRKRVTKWEEKAEFFAFFDALWKIFAHFFCWKVNIWHALIRCIFWFSTYWRSVLSTRELPISDGKIKRICACFTPRFAQLDREFSELWKSLWKLWENAVYWPTISLRISEISSSNMLSSCMRFLTDSYEDMMVVWSRLNIFPMLG